MADFRTSPGTTADAGEHKTLGKTDARQAVTLGSVRYVLGISLALAIVALAVIYFA